MNYDFSKFLDAQAEDYSTALSEIRAGRKTSHWIWYIFPQLAALGRSSTAKFYGIADLNEARAYLANQPSPAALRKSLRLCSICRTLTRRKLWAVTSTLSSSARP